MSLCFDFLVTFSSSINEPGHDEKVFMSDVNSIGANQPVSLSSLNMASVVRNLASIVLP